MKKIRKRLSKNKESVTRASTLSRLKTKVNRPDSSLWHLPTTVLAWLTGAKTRIPRLPPRLKMPWKRWLPLFLTGVASTRGVILKAQEPRLIQCQSPPPADRGASQSSTSSAAWQTSAPCPARRQTKTTSKRIQSSILTRGVALPGAMRPQRCYSS